MEKSHAVGADTEVEHENRDVVEVNCADVQKKLTMPKSGQSGFDSKSIGSEDDGPAETLIKGGLECLQNKADCDSGQALMLNVSPEIPVGSRSSNGLDLPQDKDATMQWELDKNLPPIKTRREGQLCDYSPSDLSPPSPKRMRQGSKEREDQWNGLWSADGKQ